jgi:mono/diheme cytochrome c family protein
MAKRKKKAGGLQPAPAGSAGLTRVVAMAIALLLGGAGYFAFFTGGAPAPETASAGSGKADADSAVLVALGRRVYAEQCAACHGRNLEGQANWRQRLADGTLPAPPHDASGHTWHHPDRLLFDYTKFGGQALMGPGGKSAMPGFGGVLSDREIWAVLAYIKSTWPDDIRRMQTRQNAGS